MPELPSPARARQACGAPGKSDRGGLNVFLRDGESVLHPYSAYDSEIDLQMLDSSYVDLASLGLSGYEEPQSWPMHHDNYDS